MATATRLPGIQFDVASPPADEALVRMDIAALVGFAASGPLNLPVAVEDIPHFEEIFGADLVIASDELNQPVYAYLPSSVRAFFRNGGRRCWIIRVAGPGAQANQFAIPGLFKLQEPSPVQAYAVARSEGSWSDGLSVGASLRSRTLEVVDFDANSSTIGLSVATGQDVLPGDLLRLTFPGTNELLWLFVDAVKPLAQGSFPIVSNQLGLLVMASGGTRTWESLASPPQLSPSMFSSPVSGETPLCERITMDLFVQSDAGGKWTMTELGFAPTHPRYWALLPSDTELYGNRAPTGLAADASRPRFPLAGIDANAFYIPSGVGAIPSFVGLPVPTQVATDRNGLSTLTPHIFLDPNLADVTSLDLLAKAYFIQYQSLRPRNLAGIHAALGIEESTIIAAPDAVQRGWTPSEKSLLPSPPASSPLAHPEWWHFLDCTTPQKIPRVPEPPPGHFHPCDLRQVNAPVIALTPVEDARFSVVWRAEAGAVDFLEEAVDPEFVTANVIYQGSSGEFVLYGRPPGTYYYRVRRQIGDSSSDYSNAVGVQIEVAADYKEDRVSAFRDDLVFSVHCSMLQMCAARGDMFAILALPGHYRERDAIAHASLLRTSPGGAESMARGFGAIYHPWLTGREENDPLNLRNTPPDGAIAGILATRSSTRGPWIAPANEPLHGVVDLAPPVARSSRQALQDAQVNLVRQEPGGFLCLSALTLSDDPDLVPVNVRRLLSFLRKQAITVGVDYVFEPNSDEFRRSVQRGLEKMLDGLVLRGAFAGRTSQDSFQVVTDSSLNTPAAVDRGEFYVELRVAPSLPMKFLTIRLFQTADRTFVTEGG